jgi:sorbitol/mannitol transport system permease protein
MIGTQTRAGVRSAASTRPRLRLGSISLTALTYVVAFIFFFPVLWMVLTGFKTEANAVSLPPTIAFQPTLDNYRNALLNNNYLSFFVNSLILSAGSTLLAFILGIPAAYSLGLFPTRRTPNVLSWVLSTKMMPLVGIVVPLIVIYKSLGLFDTRLGMVLLYTAMNLPLVIWMMRSFFAEVPREIMEASSLDGASFLRTMVSIVLPLATPGLAATALLCVIFAWNEFFLAVNLTGPNAGPLTVYISSFMTSEGLFWAKMSAASTVAVLPVFVVGWTAQRSLVRGLTLGAVK